MIFITHVHWLFHIYIILSKKGTHWNITLTLVHFITPVRWGWTSCVFASGPLQIPLVSKNWAESCKIPDDYKTKLLINYWQKPVCLRTYKLIFLFNCLYLKTWKSAIMHNFVNVLSQIIFHRRIQIYLLMQSTLFWFFMCSARSYYFVGNIGVIFLLLRKYKKNVLFLFWARCLKIFI